MIAGYFEHLDAALSEWRPSQVKRQPGIRLIGSAEKGHRSWPRSWPVPHARHPQDVFSAPQERRDGMKAEGDCSAVNAAQGSSDQSFRQVSDLLAERKMSEICEVQRDASVQPHTH